MGIMQSFYKEKEKRIELYSDESRGVELGRQFNIESCKNGYT
jgi:hypothetical protein